jgi:hypothetical protein
MLIMDGKVNPGMFVKCLPLCNLAVV